MIKRISLLGGSGSIGQSTLEIIRDFPYQFSLHSFSVFSNLEISKAIILEFKPKYLCIVSNQVSKSLLGNRYQGTKIYYGRKFLEHMVSEAEVDIVVNAIVGSDGVYPTISAIQQNKKIAIANKETLVSFGTIIQELLRKNEKAILLPIDSEHNAIFQLLERSPKKVKSITLTASGGSLRDFPIDKFSEVHIDEVLKHPVWNMGAKITVDSASMANKCLEVIEAHVLFEIPYENINILVHPETIVHGMVETWEGSQIFYASYPDMKLPISHCLFYPNISEKCVRSLSIEDFSKLHFFKPDQNRYPILKFLNQIATVKGTLPCIFNAANEAAVDLFLKNKIKFVQITELIEESFSKIKVQYTKDLEDYIEVDKITRELIYAKSRES